VSAAELSRFAGASPGTAVSWATSWSSALSTRAAGELSRAASQSPTPSTRGELSASAERSVRPPGVRPTVGTSDVAAPHPRLIVVRPVKKIRQGQELKQMALPKGLRHRVMTLAHAGIMSGHQGVHRTQERITANFWWPGMTDDVTRFCHSCDVCRRTVSKGRVSKVPLGKMPIIDTPFKRVAIDLVGEIFLASSRGELHTHTYGQHLDIHRETDLTDSPPDACIV